ncbi:MAG: HAMP domain-containing sensor histidine kinase [Patescibacteria group bacterium]|nr:HAMP domain-containing sensor histidine kinase [Patescibacteria group bacterium]
MTPPHTTVPPAIAGQLLPDDAQSEFITIVAHQLRTPLSAVKWVLRMLIDGDVGELTPEQKSLLLKGYQSNERMINLVNDMLNVSLIESGRLPYRFGDHQLEDVLQRALFDFIGPIQRKKITLVLNEPPKKLPLVHMDPDRIRTAVQNLIDNAVEYTPPGGRITVALKKTGRDVEIAVQDSGIGIPADQQKKIFTRFFRGENAIRTETDGSGLGLFVVSSIITKHGGRVWFESQENKGTTFHCTLPTTANAH